MTDIGMPGRCPALAAGGLLVAALAIAAAVGPGPALGQGIQPAQPLPVPGPQNPQAVAPAAPNAAPSTGLFPAQPPPAYKPGFIYAFGQWWDTARGKLDDLRRNSNDAAQDAVKHAAEATRDAANAIVRVPTARFIQVHQHCNVAPNGAPDCRTAAANACRIKGFTGGHPIDVRSDQNCPPAVWMSGREPAAGECPEETVVLMAACD
jgi:hypothetical protein